MQDYKRYRPGKYDNAYERFNCRFEIRSFVTTDLVYFFAECMGTENCRQSLVIQFGKPFQLILSVSLI